MRAFALGALLLLVTTGSHAASMDEAFRDGESFGRGQNATTRSNVGGSTAATNVPHYSDTAPESSYYGSPNLETQGNAKRASCAEASESGYEGQSCNATNFSQTNPGARPQFTIAPTDPVVGKSKTIASDPQSAAGAIEGAYSDCKTIVAGTPDTYENRVCNEARTVNDFSCTTALTASVSFEHTCAAGTWPFAAAGNRWGDANAWDKIYAQAKCDIGRVDNKLAFRFHGHGNQGACADWQQIDLDSALNPDDEIVADLAPHWNHACQPVKVFRLAGSGCSGDSCAFRFLFGIPNYTCPAGETPGNQLYVTSSEGGTSALARSDQCYRTVPFAGESCGSGATVSDAHGNLLCATLAGPATASAAAYPGFSELALVFERPRVKTTVTDSWGSGCASYESRLSEGSCELRSSLCSEGPSKKIISGVPVTRDCWRRKLAFQCLGANASDCKTLLDAGCEQIGSKCIETSSDRSCALFEQTYRCKIASGKSSTLTDCGTQSYCLSGNCFSSAHPPDKDFAVAVTMLEAAKEMGDQFDPDTFRVFKGADNRCSKKLFTVINCCENGEAIEEQPLKSSCNDDEKALAKKRDAKLCHLVGSYCSQKTLGACVKKTESYCCFMSLLSRIIHEQGRPQIAKSWGGAETPDCTGFTVTELQSLDFAQMDLSEFYAHIAPKMPDIEAYKAKAGGQLGNCYYGEGQCK